MWNSEAMRGVGYGYFLELPIFFGVTFVHANVCMHILALIFQDGGNPFPVTRLPATFTSGSEQRD